ncbi:MAG: 50S ribosomal protein L21 [Patescibacteria group bacterium]
MFAVIETGGKQYRVSTGLKLRIEKIEGEPQSKVIFDRVLLKSDKDVEVGTPYIKTHVEGKILEQARDKKKIVFRYHSKTRYRKMKGHRQHYTEVEITKI